MGDHIILKTDTDVTLMANGIQKGTKDLIKDVADLKKGLDKLNGKEVTLTVKGEVDMSEVEAAKKEAAKPIETPVKLKLDASEIKALQNLPTAKAKVEFLVNKGTISKSIGKDLQAAIGKAYSDVSRKFKDFPGLDKEPNISLDNFMKRVPELSARQRSGIIQTLTDKGIISDKNIPESYETVYSDYVRYV